MSRKANINEHLLEYRHRLLSLYDSIDIDILEKIIDTLIECFKNGKTLYIAGNGGSAATSSHMQCDFGFFVRHFTQFRPKVLSLTDCTPMLTAIGNDHSYDDIFIEQLRGSFEKGDVLLTISASGNSKNVIKATEYANEKGGTTICFVGFEGGRLKEVSHISLHTPNSKGEYGPIEDLHIILNHLIVSYLVKDKEFLEIS
ncbi:MAG: SIS domain-containing protein [Bacteroidota bacterium]|jgi:D-sedoheptulose 7-phosphate isomerase